MANLVNVRKGLLLALSLANPKLSTENLDTIKTRFQLEERVVKAMHELLEAANKCNNPDVLSLLKLLGNNQ